MTDLHSLVAFSKESSISMMKLRELLRPTSLLQDYLNEEKSLLPNQDLQLTVPLFYQFCCMPMRHRLFTSLSLQNAEFSQAGQGSRYWSLQSCSVTQYLHSSVWSPAELIWSHCQNEWRISGLYLLQWIDWWVISGQLTCWQMLQNELFKLL